MIIQHQDSENTPDITHHDIYTTQAKDGAFLFHKTYLLVYFSLREEDPQLATEFLEAIFDYAFYHLIPDVDSKVWMCGFEMIQLQIDTDLGREIL